MKILRKNLDLCEIKVLIENIDDLWHILNIVEKGDFVYATTYRRYETKLFKQRLRPARGEKRKMILGIEVEKLDFQPFTDRLRISGVIRDGDEQYIGSHHTLNIEINEKVTIKKSEWSSEQLKRLENAVKLATRPFGIIVAIERGEASVAILHQYGLQQYGTINYHLPGKMYETKLNMSVEMKKFFEKVLLAIEGARLEINTDLLHIVGPGFVKDNFYKFCKQHASGIKKISIQATSTGGFNGIYEALKSGATVKWLRECRLNFEIQLVEKLFIEIAKNGLYTYGYDYVLKAVETGAVDTLLVIDTKIREVDEKERIKIRNLLNLADTKGTRTVIISSLHEGGKKLAAINGVGAILRFKI